MPKYAIVRKGKPVDWREMDEKDVPFHKVNEQGEKLVRLVEEDELPVFRHELNRLETQVTVDPDKVTINYTVVPLPLDDQKAVIKAEARRRILAKYPEWKQSNMTARGVELLQIRMNSSWTTEQTQEAAVLQAAWDWIKAVRTASDTIELMSPIPDDYDADARWPE